MANSESSVQIIPYYAHPHVHTVIVDDSYYDETVVNAGVNRDDLPFSTAIVTGADQGIDNTFVRLGDLETKQALFGKSNFHKYGQSSLQAEALFNGYTNVWFCRVLPDNATYANMILMAHYRKGKILDDLAQETGKVRLEIKFSIESVTKDVLENGAVKDDDILGYANSLASTVYDPQSGYMTIPLCYIRSVGRGNYGNNYSVSIGRDIDAEKEYGMKMYKFNLINNTDVSRIVNIFTGSLYQTIKYNASTLISDVLDQYPAGSCPISIYPFEDNYQTLYDFYQNKIVAANLRYIQKSGALKEELEELKAAQAITIEQFDPLFGLALNTRTKEEIPYYRNYTTKSSGAWVAPSLEVPNTAGAVKPLNISEWNTAFAGATVLVASDPLNDGCRWLYTVVSIDPNTGNIIYDEGYQVSIDEDQYDGVNISQSIGNMLEGGHDGDFEEISINGEMRAPNAAEMKILLAREEVKAWRGDKDRKILSPLRVNLDFLFDANYNMTSSEDVEIDTQMIPIYTTSTVLTNQEAQQLAILASADDYTMDYTDLNVKKAMYDMNEFRCRNGMTVNPEQGAGTLLHLDCGLIGLKSMDVNDELMAVINMMEPFDGRQTSIDLGYFNIFDPVTGKRISVTTSYILAKNLVPHLVKEGINKPFTNSYTRVRAIQSDSSMIVTGNMIRDTFRPDIDLIDWDVKEALYNSRINYWLSEDEGRTIFRSTQNTRQREASALLEENNVRVLNTLKKNLERACRGYLYEWNKPTVRKGYTQAQMEIYKPWIGTIVEDIQIKFTANEWETDRMIMHCYCEVKFMNIVKRIVLEINIKKPVYQSDEGGE